MPAVAIDVSDSSVKYLQLAQSAEWEGFSITYSGSIALEPNIIVGGNLEQPDMLAKVLQEISHRTKSTFVSLSLPEEHAYIFETSIRRGMKEGALRSAIEMKLEENVPIPPQEALFDYICEDDEFNEKNIRVVVTAYSKSVVEKYAEACSIAGVIPLSFQVEAEALSRAVVEEDEEGAQLILDFGATRTGIGIVENHILRYTSTIDVGSNDIFQALQDAGKTITMDEFLSYSSTKGLLQKQNEIYPALEAFAEKILVELRTRLRYWDNQIAEKQKPQITEIIICGGAANMKGLAMYCQQSLGVPVVVADVWKNVFSLEEYVPPISFSESMGYAIVVGLALETMRKKN